MLAPLELLAMLITFFAEFVVVEQTTRKKKLSSKKDGKIVVWESETDFPGVFAPYSETQSNLIEQQYAAGIRKVPVSLNASSVVQVNFTAMKAMQNRFGKFLSWWCHVVTGRGVAVLSLRNLARTRFP